MIKIEELNKNDKINQTNIPSAKLESLLNNPFGNDMNCIALEAIGDEVMSANIGSVITIPLQLVANERIYSVCGGSSLSVNPQYRGRGIAAQLTTRRIQLSHDKIAIASGLSGMSLPLFQKLKFTTFVFPRLIFLRHSRPVLEMFMKGVILKICSSLVDVILLFYSSCLKSFSLFGKENIIIEEISEATTVVEEIVKADEHMFRENHTKEWFNWVLKYPFTEDSRAKQHLYVIKKNGSVVAFFMTKERFYEQASHRGFKNIILGSVIEWGVKKNCGIEEKDVCVAALFSFGKNVDAVEVCTENKTIIKVLKRRGIIQVGESNFAIKVSEDSEFVTFKDEYSNIKNWRIRPAMSDNGLS